MELATLSENIVDVPYRRGDETLVLRVNIDAFTPQFWREIKAVAERRLNVVKAEIAAVKKQSKGKKTKPEGDIEQQLEFLEAQAKELESAREINIDFLVPHILKGWDATENGVPIEPTKDVLMRLPPRMIRDLFDVCVKAAQTVKKTDDEEETPGNTQDGSPGLRVVGQAT